MNHNNKYRINGAEIIAVRNNIILARLCLAHFLYCFNLRMKDLGIQFNINEDYDKTLCSIKIDNNICNDSDNEHDFNDIKLIQ